MKNRTFVIAILTMLSLTACGGNEASNVPSPSISETPVIVAPIESEEPEVIETPVIVAPIESVEPEVTESEEPEVVESEEPEVIESAEPEVIESEEPEVIESEEPEEPEVIESEGPEVVESEEPEVVHTHKYSSYSSNNDGTHTVTCTSTTGTCDAKSYVEECTGNTCSKCGYVVPHTHDYTTYTSNNDGTHTVTCTSTVGDCNAKTKVEACEGTTCAKCGYTAPAGSITWTTKTVNMNALDWELTSHATENADGTVSVFVDEYDLSVNSGDFLASINIPVQASTIQVELSDAVNIMLNIRTEMDGFVGYAQINGTHTFSVPEDGSSYVTIFVRVYAEYNDDITGTVDSIKWLTSSTNTELPAGAKALTRDMFVDINPRDTSMTLENNVLHVWNHSGMFNSHAYLTNPGYKYLTYTVPAGVSTDGLYFGDACLNPYDYIEPGTYTIDVSSMSRVWIDACSAADYTVTDIYFHN